MFTLTGTGFTDFGLNTFLTASNSETVTAGQTAPYTMSVTGVPTQAGVVNLSCSNLPPGASCAFSPIPVALSPGNEFMNFQLNVSTTARSVASLHRSGFRLWYSLAAVFAVALAASGRSLKRVTVLTCFLVLGLLTSCGGGSSSGPPPPTPPGTFSFVVNGNSNGVTHSKSMVLVVK